LIIYNVFPAAEGGGENLNIFEQYYNKTIIYNSENKECDNGR